MKNMEEGSTVVDGSGQFMWEKVSYPFVDSNYGPEVVEMDLSTNHVSEMVAENMQDRLTNPDYSLITLNLTQCRLTEKASCMLFKNIAKSKIRHLTLDSNIMTEKACFAMAEMIKENQNLEYLCLRNCDILANSMVEIAGALPYAENLKVLRLDNNSIFDRGATALANALRASNITSLSVSDNQIWKEGTQNLLGAITETKKMEALDISYNIIDIVTLCHCLQEVPSLTALNISGCKVNERLVSSLLETVATRSSLVTLIMDGLDYNILPIAWPHVPDKIWAHAAHFDLLIRSIAQSPSLTDVRVGFLEPDQIYAAAGRLSGDLPKEVIISMHDFGRTGNCWVVSLPAMRLDAPCSVFKWSSPLTVATSGHVGSLIRAALFEGEPLRVVDLSGCGLSSDAAVRLLNELGEHALAALDLSGNEVGDDAVDALAAYCVRSGCDLRILRSRLTDGGLARLIGGLAERPPRRLAASFTGDFAEDRTHQAPAAAADLLAANAPIESLELAGPVSPVDASKIAAILNSNGHIVALKLDADVPEGLRRAPGDLPPSVRRLYVDLARHIHHALRSDGTLCRLSSFTFPLLAEVFLGIDEILSFWGEIEQQLDANAEAVATGN